jgi:hypothetical protein
MPEIGREDLNQEIAIPYDPKIWRDLRIADIENDVTQNTYAGYRKYSNLSAVNQVLMANERVGPRESFPVLYNSYAGTDIVATILVPNEKTDLTLGELQTISYSIHRENSPVRVLGNVNPAGFVRGPRTIAGSLIFTQFDEYTFYRLQQFKEMMKHNLFPLADMLPPFDIILTFSNELGLVSKLKIFGVTIVDEGGTMSVDDLITEQTYTYMARGIQPLINYTPQDFEEWRNQPTYLTLKPTTNTISFRG